MKRKRVGSGDVKPSFWIAPHARPEGYEASGGDPSPLPGEDAPTLGFFQPEDSVETVGPKSMGAVRIMRTTDPVTGERRPVPVEMNDGRPLSGIEPEELALECGEMWTVKHGPGDADRIARLAAGLDRTLRGVFAGRLPLSTWDFDEGGFTLGHVETAIRLTCLIDPTVGRIDANPLIALRAIRWLIKQKLWIYVESLGRYRFLEPEPKASSSTVERPGPQDSACAESKATEPPKERASPRQPSSGSARRILDDIEKHPGKAGLKEIAKRLALSERTVSNNISKSLKGVVTNERDGRGYFVAATN